MSRKLSLLLLAIVAVLVGTGQSGSNANHADAADEQKVLTNSLGMKLCKIPAGEFLMGTSAEQFPVILAEDKSTKREGPQHHVTLTRGFWMGQTEVTQAQYEAVMRKNPSWFSPTGSGANEVEGLKTDQFPVDNASWFDAVEFCNQLSLREKLTPCYELKNVERSKGSITSAEVTILKGTGYRLPTEAEWEYACRAGTTSWYHFGDASNGEESNTNGSKPFRKEAGPFLERTTTVASYAPNAWGLYDMHGNVWEWCQDWFINDDYQQYTQQTVTDPQGPQEEESERVKRGGCWRFNARYSRSAYRYRGYPDSVAGANTGFRVVREL